MEIAPVEGTFKISEMTDKKTYFKLEQLFNLNIFRTNMLLFSVIFTFLPFLQIITCAHFILSFLLQICNLTMISGIFPYGYFREILASMKPKYFR